MESLKQTMLQQEMIFRNQVRELHRLYWTQKNSMNQFLGGGFTVRASNRCRELAEGKNSFLEFSRSREVNGVLNFGALEKAEGSSTDFLLNNLQRGFCHQLPPEMLFRGGVQSPAKYYLEKESSIRDGTVEAIGRGNVGCMTEEEANSAFYGCLEYPIKKGSGESCETADFDLPRNMKTSRTLLIDLNVPLEDEFCHNQNDPAGNIHFTSSNSLLSHGILMGESCNNSKEDFSFASLPEPSNSAVKTGCKGKANLFRPVQVPQVYASQDSKIPLNTAMRDGDYDECYNVRPESEDKPIERSTDSSNGASAIINGLTVTPFAKLPYFADNYSKMLGLNITSSNSTNLQQTVTRDSACKLHGREKTEEDTSSDHSVAKVESHSVGPPRKFQSECVFAALSSTDDSITTQLISSKNEGSFTGKSNIEGRNATITEAAEALVRISLARSNTPVVEYDDESNAPQYSSDSFESMTLQLSEVQSEDHLNMPKLPRSNETGKDEFESGIKLRRGRGFRDFQKEILPGLVSLSRHEICEDLHIIGCKVRRTASRIARENWFVPARSRRTYSGRRRR
ncbi:hypothetical protein AXF42_Ash005185 [Apostasia shenzhenica]|uniref:Uncharacterized protein n=1 Tax=Apostasia shenzhenica TaxID=1088818 RepID=A0A2I0B8P6_9ASPA|nr:hypothetical protein AXF42_Ash005185 [Apostasia shenzhenica]